MIYNSLSKETLSKETLIKIIEDQNIKIESQKIDLEEKDKIINKYNEISLKISPVSISPISINNWRLQAWGGNANGKSQAENKRNIMNIFCKKNIHLIDLIKVDKNNKAVGINNNRNNQMKRLNEGDKVYMCDNINFYYEGFIKENYKHYENDKLIKEHKDIIDIVWGISHWEWQNNLPKLERFYISQIDWVKKPLTKEMKLYLVKSIKNGGGRIDMQGTVLKLNNYSLNNLKKIVHNL